MTGISEANINVIYKILRRRETISEDLANLRKAYEAVPFKVTGPFAYKPAWLTFSRFDKALDGGGRDTTFIHVTDGIMMAVEAALMHEYDDLSDEARLLGVVFGE